VIPPFESATGNLPPGVHEATWEEAVARYGYTPQRLGLLAGRKAALDALRLAGCRRAYIDGSFVSNRAVPADFDGCWELEGVDLARLDPVLKTFANQREAQKQMFSGELFPADWEADAAGTTFLRFFQRDRNTGRAKGILTIDLGTLP
jgi:hypothetical protein